jgi:zinc protease
MAINRSIKPIPVGEISFTLPKIQKSKLKNGLKILFVKKDDLPILQYNLVINAGSKNDPADKKGLVNLSAMMMDEGAGKFNALELNDEFDTLGANFTISRNEDSVFISLQSLKENYRRALELFGLVITDPHLKEEDFQREKRKVLTRIIQIDDDPEEIANSVFGKIIFGNSNPYAYPTIGYAEHIEKITNEEIKTFYKNFIRPDNAQIVVVGNTTLPEVKEDLKKIFKEWMPNGSNGFEISRPEQTPQKIYLVHKKDSVQSEIRIGHLSTNRDEGDFYSKTILNTVLGGQFSSRINLNLREDKGYTYGAFSRFNHYKAGGYFHASTSVSAENTGSAIKEILNELGKIREGITFEELAFAQSSIIRKFPSNFETFRQIGSNLTGKIIHSLADDYFDCYIDRIKEVTEESVKEAALELIHPDEAIIVIVADREKIADQLESLGLGEVEQVNHRGEPIAS